MAKSFYPTFPIAKASIPIIHGSKILFLGSCFSDEIANKAEYFGFNVVSNPFGTVFHPSVLSRFLIESIDPTTAERIFERDGLFFSWDANTTISATSRDELSEKLHIIRTEWIENLRKASHLFVTFGTAWGYELIETSELVANCHKMPQGLFCKKRSGVDAITQEWLQAITCLRTINPTLEIVFTVSPVRHFKDGWIENNRSKASLFQLIQNLEDQAKCSYFPSYEIVVDELRDYRFYKIDRTHPTEEAVDYIWDRLSPVYFSSETQLINDKMDAIRKALAHRPQFISSTTFAEHVARIEKQREELRLIIPGIQF
jgi:hypothetical protein